jgi:hypothetical protein
MSGRTSKIIWVAAGLAGLLGIVFLCFLNWHVWFPAVAQVSGGSDAELWVDKALKSWMSGHTTLEFMRRADHYPQEVDLIDRDWEEGKKLIMYQILSIEERDDRHWRVTTRLSLEGERGAEVQQKTSYHVSKLPSHEKGRGQIGWFWKIWQSQPGTD